MGGVWGEKDDGTTAPMDEQLVYIGLELVIACLSVIGNVLVCWAVCLNSNLQSITNFFVVSLAVADIAVGLLAIPFAITISTGFCAYFHGCLFIACFVLVLTQSSIFSLLAIAMDRYIAIKSPLRYNSLVTSQRAKGIIAVCWILSVGIGLTPMLGWNTGFNVTANSSCPDGMTECLFEGVVSLDYMVYFNFFGCVLAPLMAMLAIYISIFMAARRQLRLMMLKVAHVHAHTPAHGAGAPPAGSSRSTLQKEVHAAKSLAIIVGLFALCWLPLHVINCFNLLCQDCGRPHIWVMNIAIILSHANSVVNPFIYAYRLREFRLTFRRILHQHILGQRGRREIGVGGRGGRSVGGSSTIRTQVSVVEALTCETVENSYALDPSPEHSPPKAPPEASVRWKARLDPTPIGYITNGRCVVESTLLPGSQSPCVIGYAGDDIEESYLGGPAGVLEVKETGSGIYFVNVGPLCPSHSGPAHSGLARVS